IWTSIWFYYVHRIGGYVLFCFFWIFSHSSLAPAVEIGGIWLPKGIGVLDPWEIPFLNTPILPSSGATVTWTHHAILAGKKKRAVYALVATVLLALVFAGFQGMKYYQAPFTISDSIYGSTFFLATFMVFMYSFLDYMWYSAISWSSILYRNSYKTVLFALF
ncbi:hypothetical protein HID58_043038, partial [Brassica napus]